MNYFEYKFNLNPVIPFRDILIAQLAERGFESFVETDEGLLAYISEQEHAPELLKDMTSLQFQETKITWEFKLIPDENWNAEWEKNFSPIDVEGKCYVRAPFHTARPDYPIELIIEPKMSFGTGHHATTWLMLRELFNLELSEKQVLDMGSGTGVLAILASRLGALHTDAIDNDEWAFKNAIENFERNNTKNVTGILGDVSSITGKTYDVILANINRNILTRDSSGYLQSLSSGADILLSGFYSGDVPVVLAAFPNCDLISRHTHDDWTLLHLRKG